MAETERVEPMIAGVSLSPLLHTCVSACSELTVKIKFNLAVKIMIN